MSPSRVSRLAARAPARAAARTGPGVRFGAVLGFLGAVLLTGCGPAPDPAPTPGAAPPATPASTNAAAAPAPAASGDLAKVVGRWLRPDGGYVLELSGFDPASGRLTAAYLNPQPIHVARAEAKMEGGKASVFVELQDVNYPGCTYRLTYFPATDQLYGVYFQAAIGQSFDVEFVRQPR